jgi:hypothetical protein
MPRATRLCLVSVVCALFAGCAPTKQIQIPEAPSNQRMAIPTFRCSDASKSLRCSVKILAQAPPGGARNLGTIHLAGRVSREAEVITLVDQMACEIGADAIFVRQIEQRSTGGQIDYKITASAYALSSGEAPPAPEGQRPAAH